MGMDSSDLNNYVQRGRRIDDWKTRSDKRASITHFMDVAEALGYDPSCIMSIRMNPNQVIVTWRDESIGGMPRSTAHDVVVGE